MDLKGAPQTDELEVTIFGPGFGESILVHLGDERWVAVDSAKFLNQSWPLYYLKSIGVDPSKIQLIVASHWHSDHVLGISDLVKASPDAQFACSSALRMEEFQRLLARYKLDEERAKAPLVEIHSVFQDFYIRKKQDPAAPVPKLLTQNSLVSSWSSEAGIGVEIWALSPSPADVLGAMQEFSSIFVPLDEYASGISPIDQNSASVALSIKVGNEVIVLGSDLEAPTDLDRGWNAVVGSWQQSHSPSVLYKIPHHGSSGAYSEDFWKKHVSTDAIAVITPYTRSNLPRSEEIEKLKALGRKVFATALPQLAIVERGPTVDREVRMTARGLRSFRTKKLGAVRLRKQIGSAAPWQVETFGDARQL